ncbi:MAG: serine/threonine-protein kinase [Planctomycetota bacterium]
MADSDSTAGSNGPEGKGRDGSDAGGNGERKLIEAALQAAEPKSSWPENPRAWAEGPPMPPAGAFPGYELVREIHRGGQGVVYQAVQLATRRRVAIKVMHSGPFMGSSGRARFEREVQVLGQLDHPNIVRIHDSGVTGDGSCFYVMDYISGKPLDRLIAAGKLPIREGLQLFAKICDAVNAAHLKGVIHRDLKPANVRIDDKGEPIVVDFGLAKTAVPELDGKESPRLMSMTGQFIGSLPWASPEQAEGSPAAIDVRTDVYSLGVMLYQLLTGRFPYEVAGNMRDVLDNILKAEPARPSTIRRQINDEVETIILKSLAKDRDRRYQSAGDLGRDITRFLHGQPIEAKRDSGWYVITKTLRRYRVPVGLGVAAAVALVVFAITITVLYGKAEDARADAVAAGQRESVQRQLAERRRDQAFELARVMLNDYWDSINALRGATPAKIALGEAGVGVLDELDADGDPENTLEKLFIGRERLRVGSLYTGRRGMHRVGSPELGMALYRRALADADGVLATEPESAEALALRADALASIGHAERLQRGYAASQAALDDAVAAYDRLIDAAGEDAAALGFRLDRADAMFEMGNAYLEQSMRSADGDQRQRAADRAEMIFARTLDTYDGLEPGDDEAAAPRIARGRAHVLDRQARMLGRRAATLAREDGRRDEAVALFDRAIAMAAGVAGEMRQMAERDPASGVYDRESWVAIETWGDLLRQQAMLVAATDETESTRLRLRAIEVLGGGAESAGRAVLADESNVLHLRAHALLLNKLGRALEDLGRYAEARSTFDQSLAIRRDLAATDPTNQHRSDAVVGWYRLGALLESQASGAGGGGRGLLEEALDAYEQAAGFVQQQIDAGEPPGDTHQAFIEGQIDRVRGLLSDG